MRFGTALRAGNGTRTRDPQLGKLMLYQLSYSRNIALYVWNRNLVEIVGVEPTTSCMPCKRSSQLSYTPKA